MSEGKTPRNPARGGGRKVQLDRALAEWPARAQTARSALERDEAAERVLARIGSGEAPRSLSRVSDEDLLAAPLPFSPDEVQDSAPPETPRGVRSEGAMSTASRERDRASLKDLAKLASMGAPASGSSAPSGTQPVAAEREENSGVIHLAALTSGGQAGSAEAAPLSAPVLPAPVPAAPPAPVVIASAATVASPRSEKSKKAGWLALGGLLAAAAVAAGVFIGMRPAATSPEAVAVAVTPAPPLSPPAQPHPGGEPARSTVTPSPIAPDDRGVDPSTLPAVQNGSGARPAAPRSTPASPAAAAPGAAQAAVASTAAAAPPTPATSTAGARPSGAGGGTDLQGLMQQAAGVTSSPAGPTATSGSDAAQIAPGSVPLRPSFGAVQGALGAALPGARACLGPDDAISRATVTFKSDGSVGSVSVTGGAAGKPAEDCIRTALMRARVAPFAQPSFSAPATIRPN